MVQEAEQNAAADKEKSRQVDIKNEAETLCYQTKNQLEQFKTSYTSEDTKKIENLVLELENLIKKVIFLELEGSIKTDYFNSIQEVSESLKQTLMKLETKSSISDDPV